MTIYSPPPPLRDWQYDKPTVLVCWWITIFCASILAIRVAGRFIRTERLFREDKMAALSLVPMLLRMGCVHYILREGTNNADFSAVVLSPDTLRRKQIASGLVLASRVLYAATLWILKDSVLEFFRRLTGVTWSKAYEKGLFAIRCTLAVTFCAVVISTLAECHPFQHYWQVLPDPGGQCRQGYAQLITMASCNILTDLLLVFFPVPIILRTSMPLRRRAQLVLLFSLSLAVVGVTAYRVPNTIRQHGLQQYRSLLASVEMLFATGAANSLVLGSFVRDRGLKKRKFDWGSVATAADSLEAPPPLRRSTVTRHWGSDDNLVRELGLGVDPALRDRPDSPNWGGLLSPPRPLVLAGLGGGRGVRGPAGSGDPGSSSSPGGGLAAWQFPGPGERSRLGGQRGAGLVSPSRSTSTSSPSTPGSPSSVPLPPLMVSFHEPGSGSAHHTPSSPSSPDAGGVSPLSDSDLVVATAPPPSPPPPPPPPPPPSLPPPPPVVITAGTSGLLRGSTSILQDLGARLRSPASRTQSPSPCPSPSPAPSTYGGLGSPPHGVKVSRSSTRGRGRHGNELLSPIPQTRPLTIPDPIIQDPGGLLGNRSHRLA